MSISGLKNIVTLVMLKVVPILNENDSICTEELRFGDNDTLAAHCAVAIDANFLFFLTDVDYLYTRNPNKFPGKCRMLFGFPWRT